MADGMVHRLADRPAGGAAAGSADGRLRRAPDGRRLLAIWRSSAAFEAAHAAKMVREWNAMVLSRDPGWGRDPIRARFGRPLPLPDGAFDVVYLLHVLEHHREDELPRFFAELRRVLRPGGHLRLSTPDAEADARFYLAMLARVRAEPSVENDAAYGLAVTRMIDQCVRSAGGGEMKRIAEARAWRAADMQAAFGAALDFLIEGDGPPPAPPPGWRRHSLRDVPFALWRRTRALLSRGHPAATGEYDLLKPDRFVLRALLEDAGFRDVAPTPPDRSRIPGWDRWDLDRIPGGGLLEPGLYLEATRR